MKAAITVDYHSFEFCEDLTVTFAVDLQDGGCQNIPPLPDCVYSFTGWVHVRLAGVDQITPVPFNFQYTVGFQQSGTFQFESITIPASALNGLSLGATYDIVIELTDTYIPIQQPETYKIFSPCFNGNVDTGAPAIFSGPSCFQTVDNFIYEPVLTGYTWQQDQILMCSWPGGCQFVNSLSATFSANANNAGSYEWYVDGTQVIGANIQDFTYPFPTCGYYTVRLDIASNQCVDSYSETVHITNSPFSTESEGGGGGTQRLGQHHTLPIIQLDILPNPLANNESLTLRYAIPDPVEVKIVLYDVQGKAVYATTRQQAEGPQQLKLPLPELTPGIYQIMLAAGEVQAYHKLMIY